MASHLRQLGLDYQFFDAVDGRTLSDDEVRQVYDEERARRTFYGPLNRGEIGCALSHVAVWERIVADNTLALVLEDDTVLDPATPEILAALPGLINPQDVVVLVKTNDNTFYFRQRELPRGRRLVYVNQPFYGALGYVMTPGAARRFIARAKPLCAPIDFWYDDIGFRGIAPIRAVHPELVSHPLAAVLQTQIGGRERHLRAPDGRAKERSPLRAAWRSLRLKLKNRFFNWPACS